MGGGSESTWAYQIEQPFLKQGIDRFPFRRGVTKELFEGESAH